MIIIIMKKKFFQVTEIYWSFNIYNNERFYLIKTSNSQEYSFEPESNFINKDYILEKLNIKTINELNLFMKKIKIHYQQKIEKNKYMKKFNFKMHI